ncbi:hypothetical protein [Pseudomonas sp. TH32]|uniref:hypothetical protein n=1 Tax=Pseudomonas sp. TH32 TaxID=2796397 RepID=UPI001F5BD845|nr:hypothetical protein [Pseudomonas sp. TH32]
MGDKVLLYFSDMDLLPTGAPTLVSLPLTSATGRIFVDVPSDVFRRYPGALFLFCFYRLEDRAENVNPLFSQVARVGLQTSLPPATYPRPSYPQAPTSVRGTMTCDNLPPIWLGVEVYVAPHPDIQEGDLVTMRFQGYGQNPDVDPDPAIIETLDHYWDSADEASGYSFWILDVERLIRPLKKNAGGEAKYRVIRRGVDMGRSFSRFVQFDRLVPSSPPRPDPLFCWIDGNNPEP